MNKSGATADSMGPCTGSLDQACDGHGTFNVQAAYISLTLQYECTVLIKRVVQNYQTVRGKFVAFFVYFQFFSTKLTELPRTCNAT